MKTTFRKGQPYRAVLGLFVFCFVAFLLFAYRQAHLASLQDKAVTELQSINGKAKYTVQEYYLLDRYLDFFSTSLRRHLVEAEISESAEQTSLDAIALAPHLKSVAITSTGSELDLSTFENSNVEMFALKNLTENKEMHFSGTLPCNALAHLRTFPFELEEGTDHGWLLSVRWCELLVNCDDAFTCLSNLPNLESLSIYYQNPSQEFTSSNTVVLAYESEAALTREKKHAVHYIAKLRCLKSVSVYNHCKNSGTIVLSEPLSLKSISLNGVSEFREEIIDDTLREQISQLYLSSPLFSPNKKPFDFDDVESFSLLSKLQLSGFFVKEIPADWLLNVGTADDDNTKVFLRKPIRTDQIVDGERKVQQ